MAIPDDLLEQSQHLAQRENEAKTSESAEGGFNCLLCFVPSVDSGRRFELESGRAAGQARTGV